MPPCLYENLQGNYFLRFFPLMREILHAWWDFFIDAGDFTYLAGEREKKCQGGILPLNAAELEALHLFIR